MDTDNGNMVKVTDASLTLGSTKVLKDLNMTVKKMNIYGLLGPSGCGKTILLKCILGVISLDNGLIKLSVNTRKNVGYMPQEVALFNEFTIKEMFFYFGKLFGIQPYRIDKKLIEYTDILGLPNYGNRIELLSAGEQRRVSFAITLLHEPELLVLDEPTVGVDPILSQKIWRHLFGLSVEGKTIIITTHYVEEARHSHCIGLMRAGTILCEDNPENIMVTQCSSTLEGAFLEICKKQDTMPIESMSRIQTKMKIKDKPVGGKPLQRKDKFRLSRFNAQLMKNILWMKKNPLIMAFLLILPAVQSILFCISYGQNPKNLKFIMYSEELPINLDIDNNINNLCEREIMIAILNDDYNCTINRPLSCDLFKHLSKSLDINLVHDMETARSSIISNEAWGVVHLKENFTESIMMRIHEFFLEEDDIIDDSMAYITMDMSNYIIANYLQKLITDSYLDFKTELLKKCDIDVNFGWTAMKFENPIFGNNDPLKAHSGLPGFFCSFCFYFTMVFTSGAIMMEKIRGLLDRSMVAGMTYYEVVAAHLIVQSLLMTVQKFIMIFVFYACYDNPMVGSLTLIIALLYFIEAVGIAYGFFLTELFSSDRLVSFGGIGGTLAIFSLGGILWPLEGAHTIVRACVWLFPVAPAVESYKMISSKGYPLTHPGVTQGFVSCTLWTLFLVSVSIIIGRMNNLKNYTL